MRISDWSSDVCSSDLAEHGGAVHHPPLRQVVVDRLMLGHAVVPEGHRVFRPAPAHVEFGLLNMGEQQDRKSVVEGKSVSVRVDLGGRRIIKKKKHNVQIDILLTTYIYTLSTNN